MKKHIYNYTLIIGLFTLAQMSLLSQSMSVSSGIGQSYYFDVLAEESAESNYTSDFSYYLKLGFSDLSDVPFFDNISFRFEKQSGQINHYTNFGFCGMGFPPSSFVYADEFIDKYTLSFVSYPLEYDYNRIIKLKGGIALNKTISFATQDARGISSTRNDQIPFTSQIDNKLYTADLVLEIQFYEFALGNGLSILPTYQSSLGLTPEFHGSQRTQSFRHHLGLSFMWGMKKK